MHDPEQWFHDPEQWFHETATRHVVAQIMFHLGRAGVWTRLVEGPASSADLADGLGLAAPVLEELLAYLAAVDGLVLCAAGAWKLTPFGEAVMLRYGRDTAEGRRVNLFDVRVGTYGPIWQGLGAMLRGGPAPARAGGEAAEALYTLGGRLAPLLQAVLDPLSPATVVELGVTTGILGDISAPRRVGLDRSEAALGSAGSRAGEQPGLGWVQGELFEGSFARDLEPGVLFTVHLHELAAQGDLAGELARLRPQLAGWRLVAFEQPLPEEAPADRRQAEWLYAWSNVLIHHLIGNGCIHSDAGWRDLLARAGLELESAEPLGYLGYRAYVARF